MSTISIDENDKFVWQPCLGEFDEYSVDFAVNVRGEISPLGFRRRIRSTGGFAILCEPGAPQNVREAGWGERVFAPSTVREVGGVRLGIIGQAFPYTPIANPRYFALLTYPTLSV